METNLDSALLSVVSATKQLGRVILNLSTTTQLSEVLTPLMDIIELGGFELFPLLVPDLTVLPAIDRAYHRIQPDLNRLFADADDDDFGPLGMSMGIVSTAVAAEVEAELILLQVHRSAELSTRLRSLQVALKLPNDPNWQAAAARTVYCLRVLVQHRPFSLRG